jgi:hypothetical protein
MTTTEKIAEELFAEIHYLGAFEPSSLAKEKQIKIKERMLESLRQSFYEGAKVGAAAPGMVR